MTAGQSARTAAAARPDVQFRDYLQRSKAALEPAIEVELRRILGDVVESDGVLFESLNGGKKLRGCLTCLIGEALGAALDASLPRAVAVEMLQAATLIHDDYVDQDRVRRERPAVWTTEGSRRAVLIGDVVFASAIQMMCNLSREDCAAISRAVAMISAGALREPLDPANLARLIEDGLVGADLYRQIIYLKTGVLFGTACELGAISAGAKEETTMAARSYGLRIGEAYQIADDLMEVEQHVRSRHIEPFRMMALAPAFICFQPEMRSDILYCLKNGPVEIDEEGLQRMSRAKSSMKAAIDGLLRSAVGEIAGSLPSGAESVLALAAPWTTIDMFNET